MQASAGHDNSVTCVTISADRELAATGSKDGTIILWRIRTQTMVHELLAGPRAVSSLAFSPTVQNRLIVCMDRPVSQVWDIIISSSIASLHSTMSANMTFCTWSSDGSKIATGGWGQSSVEIWDSTTYQLLHALPLNDHGWRAFGVFSSDGARLSLRCGPESFCSWNTENAVLPKTHEIYHCISAFSPDGQYIATAAALPFHRSTGVVHIWNVETGDQCLEMEVDGLLVRAIAFSADGGRVLSVSERSITISDSSTGSPLFTIHTGCKDPVATACFSPDGKLIASAADSGKLQLWDAHNGTRVGTFNEHRGREAQAVFSPDGDYLLSYASDGTVVIRPLERYRHCTRLSR